MSPFRRLVRVPTTKLVLFVLVYSVVLCHTSSTFDFFKRATSPGSGGAGPGSGSASKTTDGARDFENSRRYSGSVSRSGEESHQINVTSQPGASIESYEHSADDSGQGQGQVHSHSYHGDGHHYGKDSMMMARSQGGWGGWGWGWGGAGGHGGDSTLDLYSVLGGLSFASLLGATIAYLARRSTGTTTVMMNTSGRRRRRDLDDADEELAGESLAEFLAQLGVHLESPWWKKKKSREEDNKFVVPFKLNM